MAKDKSKDQFTEYVDRALAGLPSEVTLNLNDVHKDIAAALLQAFEAGQKGEQLDIMPRVTGLSGKLMDKIISQSEGTPGEQAVIQALTKAFF